MISHVAQGAPEVLTILSARTPSYVLATPRNVFDRVLPLLSVPWQRPGCLPDKLGSLNVYNRGLHDAVSLLFAYVHRCCQMRFFGRRCINRAMTIQTFEVGCDHDC